MRRGMLGGSFDPPHLGHVAMARRALEWGLDEVRVVPAAVPPHKRNGTRASSEQRLAMARLAFAGVPGCVVDPIEIARGGISYTIDTLREYRKRYPEDDLVLMVGEDNWLTIETWKGIAEIRLLATLLVFGRGQQAEEGEAEFIRDFEEPHTSSEIRQLIAAGDEAWKAMVPEGVGAFIDAEGLYRHPPNPPPRRAEEGGVTTVEGGETTVEGGVTTVEGGGVSCSAGLRARIEDDG